MHHIQVHWYEAERGNVWTPSTLKSNQQHPDALLMFRMGHTQGVAAAQTRFNADAALPKDDGDAFIQWIAAHANMRMGTRHVRQGELPGANVILSYHLWNREPFWIVLGVLPIARQHGNYPRPIGERVRGTYKTLACSADELRPLLVQEYRVDVEDWIACVGSNEPLIAKLPPKPAWMERSHLNHAANE